MCPPGELRRITVVMIGETDSASCTRPSSSPITGPLSMSWSPVVWISIATVVSAAATQHAVAAATAATRRRDDLERGLGFPMNIGDFPPRAVCTPLGYLSLPGRGVAQVRVTPKPNFLHANTASH